jgi:HEAT repeat protein
VNESLQVELTEEHLPVIHAIVLRRRARRALFWQLGLGALTVGAAGATFLDMSGPFVQVNSTPQLIGRVVVCGNAVVGAGVFVLAAIGLLRVRLQSLCFAGVLTVLCGAWTLLVPILGQVLMYRYGWAVNLVERTAAIGAIQLVVGLYELRVCRRTRDWLKEAEVVTDERCEECEDQVGDLFRREEEFRIGRLEADVSDRSFLSPGGVMWSMGRTMDCVGRLTEDRAILLARNWADCMTVPRDLLASEGFTRWNSARVKTETGPKMMTFMPQSALAVAHWAGLPVTAKQMRAAVGAGLPVEALHEVAQSAEPDARAAGVKLLLKYKKQADRVPELAVGYLDDSDPSVRREALKVLKSFADPIGEARAVELLHDDENSVRKAAEQYLAAIRSGASSLPMPDDVRRQ